MPKEITVSKTTKKAIVDDHDFDMVNKRKWYYDQKNIYAKVMVPIPEGENLHHKSYELKIRLDRYIYRLTTHNNVRIKHMLGDVFNNTRHNMQLDINKKDWGSLHATKYLGVTKTKEFLIVRYFDKKGNLQREKRFTIPKKISYLELNTLERRAALLYDQWALVEEGYKAKTNFLPDSIYL